MLKKGVVYQVLAGFYDLKYENQFLRLRASGLLRHQKEKILVGDEVYFDKLINEIIPRRNSFIRPKVANVDFLMIIISSLEPNFSDFLLDKFLALAYLSKVSPLIVFTKIDLGKHPHMDFYKNLHQTFFVRLDAPQSYQSLHTLIKNKRLVLCGQSGVGKTTIFNHLLASNYQTQTISKALGRGKHTTRVVRMHDLASGQIIDSPGFSVLELESSKTQLAQTFYFFKDYLFSCKFKNCLHNSEDFEICFVKKNWKAKIIPDFRYQNYLKLLKQLEAE